MLGLMFGAILALLLLCVPGSVLFYFTIHPVVGMALGGFIIAAAALALYALSRSIVKATVGTLCVLAGLVTSVVPPFAPALRAASSWITFSMYKSELDRQADNLPIPSDNDVAKVTVESMMLMSRGYAYVVSEHQISDDSQWASKLGIPCVHVSHLYGHYYAWYSTEHANRD